MKEYNMKPIVDVLENAIEKLNSLKSNIERYKIQGKSITTKTEKWFYFNSTEELNDFKIKYISHYPAWIFDFETLTKY